MRPIPYRQASVGYTTRQLNGYKFNMRKCKVHTTGSDGRLTRYKQNKLVSNDLIRRQQCTTLRIKA